MCVYVCVCILCCLPSSRRESIPCDKRTYRLCFAAAYVHHVTNVCVVFVFSGTSTIYFIRPKYCALLVRSNMREKCFFVFVFFLCFFFFVCFSFSVFAKANLRALGSIGFVPDRPTRGGFVRRSLPGTRICYALTLESISLN